MKKNAILLALLLTAGFSLYSCKNAAENKTEMITPLETTASNENATSANTLTSTQAKEKTISNLQEAFNGESNATARYAAFSRKAAEEGHKEIALLFKAASMAEKSTRR